MNESENIDLSNAEKVIKFRLSIWEIIFGKSWIPLIMFFLSVFVASLHVYRIIEACNYMMAVELLIVAILMIFVFMWFFFLRHVPLLYNQEILFAVLGSDFVYMTNKVTVRVTRQTAKVYKGNLNTYVISTYGRLQLLINADAISLEELKSYIK